MNIKSHVCVCVCSCGHCLTVSWAPFSIPAKGMEGNVQQWHFSPDTTDWKNHHEEGLNYYYMYILYMRLPSAKSHLLFSPPSPFATKRSREPGGKQNIKRITALVLRIRWKNQVLNALITLWMCFSFLLTLCKDLSHTDELNNQKLEWRNHRHKNSCVSYCEG